MFQLLRSAWINWLTPLFLAVPVLAVVAGGGVLITGEGRTHFIRVADMIQAWSQGNYLPRWSDQFGYGLGSPLFSFVPPLPYLYAAALHQLGIATEAAYIGLYLLAVLLLTAGVFRLARDLFGIWPGIAAGVAVLYSPFMLSIMLVRGNAEEMVAWAVAPWALWAQVYLYAGRQVQGRLRYVGWLALAVAGALLSHLQTGFLLLLIVLAENLFLFLFTRRWQGLVFGAAGVVLGTFMAIGFWWPALDERQWVQLGTVQLHSGLPAPVPWAEMIGSLARPDPDAMVMTPPVTWGPLLLALGALGGIAIVFGALGLLHRLRHRRPLLVSDRFQVGGALFFVFPALIGVGMALSPRFFLWGLLPAGSEAYAVRQPGFAVMGLGVLVAALVHSIAAALPTYRRVRVMAIAGGATALLLAFQALPLLYPRYWESGHWGTSAVELVRYQAGTTTAVAPVPVWVTRPAFDTPYVQQVLAGEEASRVIAPLPAGVEVVPLAATAEHLQFQVTASEPASITLALHYFPAWRATGGDAGLPLAPEPVTGLMQVGLRTGSYVLSLDYTGSALQVVAHWLGILAWLGWAILYAADLWVWQRRRNSRVENEPLVTSPSDVLVPWTLESVIVITSALLVLRWLGQLWVPSPVLPPAQPPALSRYLNLQQLTAPARIFPGEQLNVTASLAVTQPVAVDYGIRLVMSDGSGRRKEVAAHFPAALSTSEWVVGSTVPLQFQLDLPADREAGVYELELLVQDRNRVESAVSVGEVELAASP